MGQVSVEKGTGICRVHTPSKASDKLVCGYNPLNPLKKSSSVVKKNKNNIPQASAFFMWYVYHYQVVYTRWYPPVSPVMLVGNPNKIIARSAIP